MTTWIWVAAFGAALSILGLLVYIGRFRRGEITYLHLFAIVAGYLSFMSFVIVSCFRPGIAGGPAGIVLLLPAFVSIVLLVREHGKSVGSD